MDIFLQQIINGLVIGSIYALIALGYTMVYGILNLINFAHGEVLMFGAMITFSAVNFLAGMQLPLPGYALLLLGLLLALPPTMLLGYTIERVAYRRLRKAPRLAPLITAIGMSIVLQQTAVIIWGRDHRPFPDVIQRTSIDIAGATITDLEIGMILISLALMIGLLIVVEKSRLGRAMRATAQNPEVAGLMGVNINTVVSLTFIIGSALAAVAGIMVAANDHKAQAYMGTLVGLKAFTAAVLGGIGNLGGAVAGGFLLGVIESIGAGYLGPLTNNVLGSQYQDIFAFLVLILVLVFRPSGLLGEKMAERA
ncbi:MAG: branched-chain amino acid ABC transporter permease [Neisseriaceae bacterium]|nr:MAG: branched-chain amino acid ABC transporter permease [Neisseriaceae bacterium]